MHWFQRGPFPNLSASSANLRRMCWLRSALLFCEMAGLIIASVLLNYPLPIHPLLFVTLLNLIFIAVTLWRLATMSAPVTQQELFWQLSLDIVGQSLLLYFTGGYTNPLVSIYLVIITTGAALLPSRQSWLLTTAAILAYSLLMNWYEPLGTVLNEEFRQGVPVESHNHRQQMINLHLLGMWFTFVVSALLINYFVVIMARALRRQAEDIALNRERQLRDETIIAVALQAAGTAHELGTPLSTMAVLLADLQQEQKQNPELLSDLKLLRQQVDECKNKLHRLIQSSHYTGVQSIDISLFLEQVLEQWRLVNPGIPISYSTPKWTGEPVIQHDLSLSQAVIALLDNAAKSCRENITLSALIDEETNKVILRIDDQGSGISETIVQQAGTVILNSPDKTGMGLGLLLSCASIERLGGQVVLYNRPNGGVRTEITFPVRGCS